MENKTFNELRKVNVNDKVKTKMNLKYLSWADAWGELLTRYPDASMNVYSQEIETEEVTTTTADGVTKTITNKYKREIPYFTDGISTYVKVGVTVQGIEYIEIYPIMDLKNMSIGAKLVKMTDVNKAIQRAFVKACARHGLGLYIYSGEDMPEETLVVISQSNDFAAVKNDVIALVKKLQNSAQSDEVVRYIQEMFPGVRLSATTEEHLDKLIVARTYLASLQ